MKSQRHLQIDANVIVLETANVIDFAEILFNDDANGADGRRWRKVDVY
jgi:hypothetical protein